MTENAVKNNPIVPNKEESHIAFFVDRFVRTPLATAWRMNWRLQLQSR